MAKAKKKHPWKRPGQARSTPKIKADAPLSAAEKRVLADLAKRAGVSIETPRLAGKAARAGWKNPLSGDKKRISASDGERFYIRLKKANPAAQERVAKLVESGDYIYDRTDDDVVVYRYAEGSRFQRRAATLTEMTNGRILGELMKAACSRDWKIYYEAAGELAYRYKEGLPAGQAEHMYQQTMAYLQLRIARRGGPSEIEIGQALGRMRAELTGRPSRLIHLN